MSDDEKVEAMKRQLGISTVLTLSVPLVPLTRFVAHSFKTLGMAQTMAQLGGENGTLLLGELNRLERMMKCELEDVFR